MERIGRIRFYAKKRRGVKEYTIQGSGTKTAMIKSLKGILKQLELNGESEGDENG